MSSLTTIIQMVVSLLMILTQKKLTNQAIMKTKIAVLVACLLILAIVHAHEEILLKNRRLLGDFRGGYSKGNGEETSGDGENSTPDQNTHHFLPDQDYKPRKTHSSTRRNSNSP